MALETYLSLTFSAKTLGIEGGRAPVACLNERGCQERERNFIRRKNGTENQRRGSRPPKSRGKESVNWRRESVSKDREVVRSCIELRNVAEKNRPRPCREELGTRGRSRPSWHRQEELGMGSGRRARCWAPTRHTQASRFRGGEMNRENRKVGAPSRPPRRNGDLRRTFKDLLRLRSKIETMLKWVFFSLADLKSSRIEVWVGVMLELFLASTYTLTLLAGTLKLLYEPLHT